METTSLDANPLACISDQIIVSDGSVSDIVLANNTVNDGANNPLPAELSKNILAEELAGIKLSDSKQKGDCLYLHSQEQDPNIAVKILESIAPSTENTQDSVMFAEGIRRLKLHGPSWALGLDLPISQSAIVAAEIIATLLTKFAEEPRVDQQLAEAKLKLLLKDNCLNLLCETRGAILQAAIALPMLNTLRSLNAAEYFQTVTISSRVINQKQPSWSFEIDLLAIGMPQSQADLDLDLALKFDLDQKLESFDQPEFDQESFDQEEEHQPYPHFLLQNLEPIKDQHLNLDIKSTNKSRKLIGWQWLGATNPQTINLSACLVSLAIGLAAAIAIDRTFANYEQLSLQNNSSQNKLAISNGKQADNATDQRITNKPVLNFNIALFNEKLALLDWHTTNKRRSPEVLIVGSSRALRGIEPQTLEKSLTNIGYKDITVFNMGLDGSTARVVNIQLTQIINQPQLPRMIIWADGLRAFNSNRSDLTYDEITASSGYKQVQQKTKTVENKEIDPIVPIKAIASTPLTQSLDLLFTTLTKRQEIRTALVKKFDRDTQMLSNSEALIASTMPNTVTALDTKGFVAFDVTFDPNTYFQKYPQVPGDYDIDYRNFETNGAQFEAFANVVDFCRRNNIELLIVNMPLHNTYLDESRSRSETIFNGKMQEMATRDGFGYLDLSQAILNQAQLFSDPSHLNRKGAIAIAKLLAQNPKVRWQVLKN